MLSKASQAKLATCHEDLQDIVNLLAEQMQIIVVCGHRGEKEQNEAYASGHSKLKFPKSKHNTYPSMAVDLAPAKTVNGKLVIDWNDKEAFRILARAFMRIAECHGVDYEWGGDWKRFKDMPHFQLVD